MTTKEALEILEHYTIVGYPMVPGQPQDLKSALAHLTAMAEDYEKAKAERDYWRDEQGNENRRWRQAEAELEKVKVELSHAKEVAEGAGYRLQKAEAALLGTQVVSAKNGAVIVEQMAELARWRPLIEAAERGKAGAKDKPSIGPRYAPDCDCPDCNATRRRLGGV